jgi:hypothetical protein
LIQRANGAVMLAPKPQRSTHRPMCCRVLFAMHGTRTFALLRLGKVQEAADFAIRAGQQPNADVHAHAIAALTLATAGRIEEAHAERGRINTLRPHYNFKHFKNAFHLLDDLKDIYQRAAKLVQISE